MGEARQIIDRYNSPLLLERGLSTRKIIKDESDSPHRRLLLYSRIKSDTNNSENSQNNNLKQWRDHRLTDVLLSVVVMLITSTNSLKS